MWSAFRLPCLKVLKHVSEKIGSNQGSIRSQGADYLAYSILDAVIDTYFPVLEDLGEKLEDLEDIILDNPSRQAIPDGHRVKRSLLRVRRCIWPYA